MIQASALAGVADHMTYIHGQVKPFSVLYAL